MKKIYTLKELHKEVEKENKPFNGVPNIIAGKTSTNRPKDWYIHDYSQEATIKRMEMNFKSLEKQGKLEVSAGENTRGILPDYKEFKESEGYRRLKDSQDGSIYRDKELMKNADAEDAKFL